MRRVVYGVGMSLDGYIARPDGSVNFLFMPKDYPMGAFMQTIDTAILGRKTYEVSLSMGGSFGKEIKSYVLSQTMPAGERSGATIVNDSPAQLVGKVREGVGKNIWLMGGGDVGRQFLEEDLVDELYLGVVPVLIGSGIPAFPAGFPERKFELVENKSFSRGLISLRYARTREGGGER
jgi:dihydrofolate reductase